MDGAARATALDASAIGDLDAVADVDADDDGGDVEESEDDESEDDESESEDESEDESDDDDDASEQRDREEYYANGRRHVGRVAGSRAASGAHGRERDGRRRRRRRDAPLEETLARASGGARRSARAR